MRPANGPAILEGLATAKSRFKLGSDLICETDNTKVHEGERETKSLRDTPGPWWFTSSFTNPAKLSHYLKLKLIDNLGRILLCPLKIDVPFFRNLPQCFPHAHQFKLAARQAV
jgi:hypothetical protein